MNEENKVDVEEVVIDAEVIEVKTVRVNLGLDVIGMYKGAFVHGAKDLVPVAVAAALWVLTLWVPFINIGTTIAMFTLPVWMVAGRKISPVDIFQQDLRSRMFALLRLHGLVIASSFILLFVMASTFAGLSVIKSFSWPWLKVLIVFACAAVPFFMLTTAWAMAPFLMIDKDLDPSDALRKSFELTTDRRLGVFAVYAPPLVIGLILIRVLVPINYVGWWSVPIVVVAMATATIVLSAKVYAKLRD